MMETICTVVGMIAIILIAIGIMSFLISYARRIWQRYNARYWYHRGYSDGEEGKEDLFIDQPKPSWKPY